MGSYNVACSVSNLSLNCGDPAVFIPLEVNEYPNSIGDGNHSLIYSHCFYSPVTLPLFGEYDDYGRLALTEDANLLLVKEHFKIENIDDIFDFKVEAFKSGMFVHRKVYDALASVSYTDWSGKEKDVLEDEKYSYYRQQKSLEEAIEDEERSKSIWKDFNYAHLSDEEKAVYKEDPKISSELYYETHPYWVRAAISNVTHFSFRDYKTFNDVYQPQILEGKFKEELETFVKFTSGMFSSNNFFFPAMNGCQHGNPYMNRLLYKTSLAVTEETIKRQQED